MPSTAASRSLFARFAPLVVLLQLALPVLAHIEVVFPPGFNSKYDPQTLEADKDYSMTSPLAADGSNYPCKGYNTAANYARLNPVATLTAGTSLAVQLAGTATHGGGSCQWAISYDQGKTFAVIASIIGKCPIGLKFDVPIPANLPSAEKATLSWTWNNNLGNREMYQECSLVSITGSSATSYTGPTLFRSNTFADGTCITTEGEDIVYPNPGPSVQYLGAETANSPATVLDNCPFNEDSNVTIGPSGSSSAPSSTTSKAASSSASSSATRVQETTTTSQAAVTTTTRPASSAVTTEAPTPTSKAQATTSKATSLRAPRTKTFLNNPRVKPTPTSSKSSAPAATTPPAPKPSSAGAGFSTSSDLAASLGVTSSSSSVAVPTTTPAPPTSSAPSSSAPAAPSTSASGDAYVKCNSTTTWSLCGNGVCTFMGAVPAGTVCRDGQMVMERKRMVKREERGGHLRMKMVRRAKSAAH